MNDFQHGGLPDRAISGKVIFGIRGSGKLPASTPRDIGRVVTDAVKRSIPELTATTFDMEERTANARKHQTARERYRRQLTRQDMADIDTARPPQFSLRIMGHTRTAFSRSVVGVRIGDVQLRSCGGWRRVSSWSKVGTGASGTGQSSSTASST